MGVYFQLDYVRYYTQREIWKTDSVLNYQKLGTFPTISMKVQQKISGTFRSVQGASSFCRIRGYISTVKKNNISVIDAIGAVFDGKPFVPSLDSG